MKKSTTVLIVSLIVLIVLTFTSFAVFDAKNAKAYIKDFEKTARLKRQEYGDKVSLGERKDIAFDKINISTINSDFEIVKSDREGYEVSGNNEKYFKDNFDIKVKDGTLYIEETDRKGYLINDHFSASYEFIIYVSDENKDVEVNMINGEFTSEVSFEKLKYSMVNADVDLEGSKSYPMTIDGVNGNFEMSFSNTDANISVSSVSGDITLNDREIDSGIINNFNTVLGDGRDKITIDMVNADVVINE